MFVFQNIVKSQINMVIIKINMIKIKLTVFKVVKVCGIIMF